MREFQLEVEDGDVTDDITWDPSVSEGKEKKKAGRAGSSRVGLLGWRSWAGSAGRDAAFLFF